MTPERKMHSRSKRHLTPTAGLSTGMPPRPQPALGSSSKNLKGAAELVTETVPSELRYTLRILKVLLSPTNCMECSPSSPLHSLESTCTASDASSALAA